VHVDPGSPAGKEYAIPLESARREGAGGGAQGSGDKSGTGSGNKGASGSSPPLFGAGISQAKRHSSGGGGKNGGSGGSGGGDAAPNAAKSVAARADDGGSASLRTAGIAALVLLVGGALGLGLRRALGSSD
jgi:hypothetical protein